MQLLSERARNIIEEFKKHIEALPAEERVEAVQRATFVLAQIEKEVRIALAKLRGENDESDQDMPDISQYI